MFTFIYFNIIIILHILQNHNASDLIDKDLVAVGLGLIPGQYLRPEHIAQCEKLYFSLLPRVACDPGSHLDNSSQGTPKEGATPKPSGTPRANSPSSNRPSCPQSPAVNTLTGSNQQNNSSLGVQNLSHKELLERLHQTAEALPIPSEYKTGWWCYNDLELLKSLHNSLNERGVRERELKRFIEKNQNIVKNAIDKVCKL